MSCLLGFPLLEKSLWPSFISENFIDHCSGSSLSRAMGARDKAMGRAAPEQGLSELVLHTQGWHTFPRTVVTQRAEGWDGGMGRIGPVGIQRKYKPTSLRDSCRRRRQVG